MNFMINPDTSLNQIPRPWHERPASMYIHGYTDVYRVAVKIMILLQDPEIVL